ncbi:precorrin-3B synthase [Pseudoroseomonas rhizosphaerae]|uniref:Precorrin-3B synthase n=1 Tax=Teichococcus rhizosphaerae TaxID=1335062 RepID=A0A2C7A2I3_9PROT|nr:precorrin-3B synthase [Pseudoroseomonas rhizosphaerae]PHK94278.1 precorrin-3B synthase [Pseudoroseomonas rhizosphaerae]
MPGATTSEPREGAALPDPPAGVTVSPRTPPSVRGWCPHLFAPMETGDGLLLRVKPFGNRITAAQARLLAEIAPGPVELTNRGNLQLRGVTQPDALATPIVAASLADPDPGREGRRNIIASPLMGDDPSLSPALPGWHAALSAILAGSGPLPGKFGAVLDGGGVLPLAGVESDITLRLAPDGGAVLHLPGLPLPGVTPAALARLTENFRATGGRRLREALRLHGAGALLAGTGLAGLPAAPEAAPSPAPVGFHPYPGMARGAFGLAPPFGQMNAAALRALAELSKEFGDGTLRLTPWRAILLAGVTRPAALRAAAQGWITEPADPRLRIVACPGSAGCASGQADTRADALALLARGAVPERGLLHLSGCAKGCAHPGAAAAVLVAAPDGYALLRHARAGDTPRRTGLTLAEAAAELESAGAAAERDTE